MEAIAPGVVALVLVAACLNAAWNALVKAGGDKLLDTAMIAGTGALVMLPGAFLLPPPHPDAWGWLAASMVVHVLYYAALINAYKVGDLSYVYTLMRGTPPLLIALGGSLFLGETLGPVAWAAIAVLSAGILSLGLGRAHAQPPRATLFALGNAAVIATYTLLDAQGARAAGDPLSYAVWFFIFNGMPLLAALPWLRGIGPSAAHFRRRWRVALLGGVCTAASYTIVLWAMTRAPVAYVSALRETAVVFAALIGVLFLKEPLGRHRIAAALAVAAGAAALKLA